MNKLFILSMVTAGVVGCGGGCHWPGVSAVPGRISVSPRFVCPGSTMTLSWNATGSSVAVYAPDGTFLTNALTGSMTVPAPASSGAYRLAVDGESVSANFEVQGAPTTRPLLVNVSCGLLPSGLYGVQGVGAVSDADPHIRVTAFRVPGRSYAEVVHNGVSASLVNGFTTPLPTAVAWSGSYTAASVLENDETCASPPGPYQRTAPYLLQVEAITECR